jgi:tetratricopeptide (TPR) repeat protein
MDSAVKYGNLILEIGQKKNNPQDIARAYVFKGDIAAKRTNYAEQVIYLTKALKLAEETKFTGGILRLNVLLGTAYAKINDNDNAISHIKKGIEILNSGDKKLRRGNLPRAYTALGEIYLKTGLLLKALSCFKISYKEAVAEKINAYDLVRATEGLARAYLALKEEKQARSYFTEALKLNKHINNLPGVTSCEQGLADLLINENNSDSALTAITKTEHMALMQNDKTALLNSYGQYIRIYDRLGNYKKKSDYLEKRNDLKDTMNALIFNKALADAKIKLNNQERETENALLGKKNKILELKMENTQTYIILGSGIALCLIFVLVFLNSYNRLKDQKKNMELENTLLRSRMNPHFVYNAMNSVQYFITENDAESSQKYLAKFARLIRYIVDNSKPSSIPLKTEIEALNLYLELESLRFENRFEYSINIQDDIDLDYIQVPSMLIQPYVENAIWHGLMHKEGKGKIDISLTMFGGVLKCVIKDDGIGRTRSYEIKRNSGSNSHKSFGMSITKERLDILNQIYKTRLSVLVTDLSNAQQECIGTCVEISIPFN